MIIYMLQQPTVSVVEQQEEEEEEEERRCLLSTLIGNHLVYDRRAGWGQWAATPTTGAASRAARS